MPNQTQQFNNHSLKITTDLNQMMKLEGWQFSTTIQETVNKKRMFFFIRW